MSRILLLRSTRSRFNAGVRDGFSRHRRSLASKPSRTNARPTVARCADGARPCEWTTSQVTCLAPCVFLMNLRRAASMACTLLRLRTRFLPRRSTAARLCVFATEKPAQDCDVHHRNVLSAASLLQGAEDVARGLVPTRHRQNRVLLHLGDMGSHKLKRL